MRIISNILLKVNKRIKFSQGFSLVEIALIIMVAGMIMAGYVTWIAPSAKSHSLKYLETKQKINEISEAIEKFVGAFGRLPCPALNSQAFGTRDAVTGRSFAVENMTGTNCNASFGSVPTSALGLSPDMMLDGWGRKITYSVSSSLCGPTGCTVTTYNNGAATLLTINDATSGTAISTTGAYLLISHGPAGRGAYGQSGVQLAGGVTASEDENFDNDNIYTQGIISSTYQHLSFYRNKTDLDNLIYDPNIKFVDLITCQNNSTQLAAMNTNIAYANGVQSLRGLITATQVTITRQDENSTNQTYTLNRADEAVLDLMWNLQEACYILYPSDMPTNKSCPGGATYNALENNCRCASGTWNGSC
ncbi:MAG: hypothetical protein J0H68_03460 [Sphingobacteriia bacterium]|nr:hypothetical protein [Sphingobacteriia bacterium]